MKNVLEETVVEIYLVIKPTKVCHICLNGPVSLAELNELICWIHVAVRVFCNECPLKASVVMNPSAVYLQGDPTKDRLDMA